MAPEREASPLTRLWPLWASVALLAGVGTIVGVATGHWSGAAILAVIALLHLALVVAARRSPDTK